MTYKYFLFIIALWSCNQEEQVNIIHNVDVNQNRFKQIQITLNDHEILRAKIYGDSLNRIKDINANAYSSEFFNNVLIKLYDKEGKQETLIKSDYCKIHEATHFLYIKDNVYIETIQQDTIRCKDMTWNNVTEKFSTQDSISIKRPSEKITGIGFEGNADLSDYKIFKTVGATSNKRFEF